MKDGRVKMSLRANWQIVIFIASLCVNYNLDLINWNYHINNEEEPQTDNDKTKRDHKYHNDKHCAKMFFKNKPDKIEYVI